MKTILMTIVLSIVVLGTGCNVFQTPGGWLKNVLIEDSKSVNKKIDIISVNSKYVTTSFDLDEYKVTIIYRLNGGEKIKLTATVTEAISSLKKHQAYVPSNMQHTYIK